MRYITMLFLVLVISAAAYGEQQSEMDLEEREIELEARQQEIEMDLEEREIELESRRREMEMELEEREIELAAHRRMADLKIKSQEMALKYPQKMSGKHPGHHKRMMCPIFMVIMVIVHILLSVWVYKDIRRRNRGSGLWIAIALLTGLLGTGVYAIVRIGDKDQNS
ncbi:MAG TPA: hypothetical protein ENH94_01195 [Phycisphaerales bacterium]|nr:hypothetical protein [Phycisphaerales bacterium]